MPTRTSVDATGAVEGGRRALHPPAFVERERAFRNYQRAIEWEKRHIARLLRVS